MADLIPSPLFALAPMFDAETWGRVPFHFWTIVFFVFGTIVGSFLNVCIYRIPIGQSIVSPPSHCPHCNYSIPWYLNIPLFTWLYLRGRCANCHEPISIRYFLVELLTGLLFMGCWLRFGSLSAWLAIIYCIVVGGLIVAAFIDLEHFIIPDGLTIGGIVTGFVCSFCVPWTQSVFPSMKRLTVPQTALIESFLGAAVGALVIYGIVRVGKFFLGRKKVEIAPDSKIIFSETGFSLPDGFVEYGEVFYRKTDAIRLHAKRLELIDRCYVDVDVELQPERLRIGTEELNPEKVLHMEVITDGLVVPREAMGLGDVKFMAAIGAFLGWPAVVFTLAVSAFLGSVVGVTMILLKKKERSSQIPYGPYIAMAAIIWLFGGSEWMRYWFLGQ